MAPPPDSTVRRTGEDVNGFRQDLCMRHCAEAGVAGDAQHVRSTLQSNSSDKR